jgi:TetR/AcrR family transcriptional repressor of uid operon
MPRIAPEARLERRQALLDAAWQCAARLRFQDLTVDDVCAAAGVSKGAFYGYFASKQALLLALLDQQAADLDRAIDELDRAAIGSVERLRRFARAILESGDDPARAQVRADLWADILTMADVRERLSATIQRRRAIVRGWVEQGVASGELVDVPTNAMASMLLALADGLLLHAGLDADAFRWVNVRRGLDLLLAGISRPDAQAVSGAARAKDS